MRISNRGNEMVITIPTNLIDIADIQEFIDFLRYRMLVAKSKATEKDIEQLSEEINKELGEHNKPLTQ